MRLTHLFSAAFVKRAEFLEQSTSWAALGPGGYFACEQQCADKQRYGRPWPFPGAKPDPWWQLPRDLKMSIQHLSGNWWSAGILVAPQHNPMNVCKGFQGKKGQTVMPVAECQCFHPAVAKGNVLYCFTSVWDGHNSLAPCSDVAYSRCALLSLGILGNPPPQQSIPYYVKRSD